MHNVKIQITINVQEGLLRKENSEVEQTNATVDPRGTWSTVLVEGETGKRGGTCD